MLPFVNQTVFDIGIYSPFVVADDVNNDNQSDLIGIATNDYVISILLGYGDGSFGNPCIYAVGDFNSDTRPDLVVANLSSRSKAEVMNPIMSIFNRSTVI